MMYIQEIFKKLLTIAIEADTNTSPAYLPKAKGIGKKIINHAISAYSLCQGHNLILTDEINIRQIDVSSVCILMRAALESYLVFNHVFISAKNDVEESIFRFDCWDLGGYLDRANHPTNSEESERKKASEKLEIEKLRNKILVSKIYQNLSKKEQKDTLKGKWRLSKSWSQLAQNAGFSKSFFDNYYSLLCSHAHTSRLSVTHVQVTDVDSQKLAVLSPLGTLSGVIAKYIHDSIELFPDLQYIKNDPDKSLLISSSKKAVEKL